MEPDKQTENVTVRLEPERPDVAVNVYHIGRFDGYREAIADVIPIFAAIGITCAVFLIIRHWE